MAESLHRGRVIQDRTGRTVMLAFNTTDPAGVFLGSICDPFLVGRSPEHPGIVPLSPSEGTPR
ncbi:hypothetical protein [Streptomyces sp. NPDC088794]|uniref:hypothetical protein n=1 Tax=Streptomyces sp. NPDC088794 TaxID=3365902 RepID=UPI0038237B58